MIKEILLIVLGFVFLIKGADLLVDGASSVAKRLRIPEIVIGLTIVSIGTSMPELFVSTTSALQGSADMSIGNIIGLIPLFPAGLGGRDVTAIAIMTAGGIASADAKTAQLVYTAILLIVSLADGLFFVFDRGRKHTTDEPENKNE